MALNFFIYIAPFDMYIKRFIVQKLRNQLTITLGVIVYLISLSVYVHFTTTKLGLKNRQTT